MKGFRRFFHKASLHFPHNRSVNSARFLSDTMTPSFMEVVVLLTVQFIIFNPTYAHAFASCASPSGMMVVNVSNESQLRLAIANLTSNQEIRMAAGTYNLTGILYLPQNNISNVVIRGATGDRDDVVIVGKGMTDTSGVTAFGFWADNVTNVLFADFTLKNIAEHPFIMDAGVDNPTFCNLRVIDAGDQFVKCNPNPSADQGVDNGLVRGCLFEYTTSAPDNYTNGVDVHRGKDWIIEDNVFKNIRAPNGQGLAGPAILMWNKSQNTIVERNILLNCDMGIALGLIDQAGFTDHSGGVIRNNFVHRTSAQSGDVGILVADSPNTKVLNNTVVLSDTYPNAIEYRFAQTTGMEIRYNLTDGAIQTRDGATGTVANNVTNAQSNWFVDAADSNLHLVSGATAAIDKATLHVDVTDDIDKNARPNGSTPDIGADEFGGAPLTNQAPTVSAGPDRTITLPASASLDGTVSDDGLPNPPAALMTTWSKVLGPGAVTFRNARAIDTTASFSAAGTYVLRLTANDNALSSDDDMTVMVNLANQPPVVNAGPDQKVTLPQLVNLNGTVFDDGLPNPPATITSTWSKVSGPGMVTFGNTSAVDTTVSFSTAGTYVLRLTAKDGVLSSSNDVTMMVNTLLQQSPNLSSGIQENFVVRGSRPAIFRGQSASVYSRDGHWLGAVSGTNGAVVLERQDKAATNTNATIVFDGELDEGPLPSGIYILRIIDNDGRPTVKKMVIVR